MPAFRVVFALMDDTTAEATAYLRRTRLGFYRYEVTAPAPLREIAAVACDVGEDEAPYRLVVRDP